MTPKAHILIYHLPPFEEKYKTVGLASEMTFESIHTLVDQSKKVSNGVPAAKQCTELVFTHHGLRSRVNEREIQGVKRKCVCGTVVQFKLSRD